MSYGGAGGGSSRISTAGDTALSNPVTGDVLTYNGTLQKWVNGAVSGGVSSVGTIRVDDYGAIGDGASDDIAAIRAAVAALPDGGRLVFTPSKSYVTSATIEIKNKVGISIMASGATIMTTATTDDSAVVRLENCMNVHFSGGQLSHKNTGPRRNAADGLTVSQSSNVYVEAVNVGYTYSMGIRAGGSSRVTITGCTVTGSTADGIGAYGGERYSPSGDGAMTTGSKILTSAGTRFQNHDIGSKVTVYGAGVAGGDLVSTIASRQSDTQVTLADTAQSSASGKFIRIQRHSSDVSIIGNHLVNTGDDAISSVGYLTYLSPNTDIVVHGNTIIGSLARGILMCGTSRVSITGNTARNIAMAGIYCVVEVGGVTSWGCTDVVISSNVVETVGTSYPSDNYPGIGASSVSGAYPIMNLLVSDNIVRDAYSYYIEAGGYSASNDSTSNQEIVIRGNVCLGGNRNNNGILVIKATNVTVENNRIAKARTSAIAISSEVAGHVVIQGNNITQFDRGATGYAALDIGTSSPIVLNNIINGVNVASGVAGGGSNT